MAAYNPYKAVKNISDLKGKYHTAKELGGDYAQYQNEAVQYYDELAKNGYQSVADELAGSDYIKAQDILARYKEDTTVDDFYDSIAKIGTGEKSPGMTEEYSSWLNDVMDVSTGKTTPKMSEAVSQAMDSWKSADGAWVDMTKDHYQTGKDQLNFINNFDYTKQPYYSSIMETYNLYGDNAANGKLASGAAANGGNIDSYAAANAARQQLSFTNAGHQAALAAAQQNQDNWLDLYGVMGGNITDMGAINAQNLGTIAGMYNTDAAERQNAMNTVYGMYNTDSAERQNATNAMVDKYLADLGLEGTKYTTDAQERMNTANNELERYLGDLGYSSDLAGYATQERMNTADNNASYERLMAEIAGDKELANINNAALRSQQYYENQYAKEQAERDHQNALELADRNAQYSGAASALEAQKQAEIEDYVNFAIGEIGVEGSGVSDLNDVRKSAIGMFGSAYTNIIDNALDKYKKYSDS